MKKGVESKSRTVTARCKMVEQHRQLLPQARPGSGLVDVTEWPHDLAGSARTS